MNAFLSASFIFKKQMIFISEKKLSLSLAAQDIDPDNNISLTGGISPHVKDVGCKYSIIGIQKEEISIRKIRPC